ncbi:MAG: protease modulator HflC [Lachnospiraceae bacterium]|nr:protease modulator HflC [Lachnospiraceae bacterium]MBQ2116804.1 protease modulator HflC [Lachnospiraceae bacterium]MBQ2407289.1 protease modulator HflC [Lachnospiraceae bacterium]MEE0919491.1 protease modulator HflC [Lachnospiraceae bacterium]
MKKAKYIICVVVILLAIIGINETAYTTNENEYSVVKQFGKIVATNNSAGLRFKVPFIQTVNYVSKATQMYDLPASEAITSDKKTMIVDAYVLWEVTDAKLYTSSLNANATTAQARIDVIVYNAIKTTISSMTQEELIASRDTALVINANNDTHEDIEINDMVSEEDKAAEDVKVIVISDRLLNCVGNQSDQYGIKIKDVKIKVLDLPDENKAAVYNRMITERNNIAAAYKAQGESEAQIIKNTTDAEVSVMLSKAKATADATIAEGEAEYMKILADAYNNEDKADFYIFSLQLDTLKNSVNKGNTTIVLDKNNPIAKIFDGVK